MEEDFGASQWDDIPPRVASPSADPPIDCESDAKFMILERDN